MQKNGQASPRCKELNAKIIIVGDPKVGKSSILIQYSEGIFETHVPMTNGLDFRFKDIKIDDTKLKLKIWDTAGQEKYRAITSNSYKGSSGAILVFDLTDKSSLDHIQHWIRQIKNHAGENIPKILLGNKCDLGIKVSQSDIDDICKEFGMAYFETSAKLNRNITESFMHIAKEIVLTANSENNNKNENNENNKNGEIYNIKEPKKQGVKLNNPDENHDISRNCLC